MARNAQHRPGGGGAADSLAELTAATPTPAARPTQVVDADGHVLPARERVYGASPTKRSWRAKAEMGDLRSGLYRIVKADQPMTVRQVFYQAVVAGLTEKTEAEYNNTIARLLLKMRRAGEIPYSWIADNTRWMRRPALYTGLADFIERHQRAYRRDLWADATTYVEIWCEKEALAGPPLRRGRGGADGPVAYRCIRRRCIP
jgi:hypothetical protein